MLHSFSFNIRILSEVHLNLRRHVRPNVTVVSWRSRQSWFEKTAACGVFWGLRVLLRGGSDCSNREGWLGPGDDSVDPAWTQEAYRNHASGAGLWWLLVCRWFEQPRHCFGYRGLQRLPSTWRPLQNCAMGTLQWDHGEIPATKYWFKNLRCVWNKTRSGWLTFEPLLFC